MRMTARLRKFLEACCPEWRDRLEKFIATGDLDEATSDHLDGCPTCTEATDKIRKYLNRRPSP